MEYHQLLKEYLDRGIGIRDMPSHMRLLTYSTKYKPMSQVKFEPTVVKEPNPLYPKLVETIKEMFPKYRITKEDGQYFAADNGKRFITFNAEPISNRSYSGIVYFAIHEDGGTRTVFNGHVLEPSDVIAIHNLTSFEQFYQ